ncbi:PaaI family thioesterase [bacterium]|nr:PaaI family thioesterase [bacterium]
MHVTIENQKALSHHFQHDSCLLCGTKNPKSLGLTFKMYGDGGVEAEFSPNKLLQGYDGCLHGGVIASLLDSAMTNCLFRHNIQAFTADLHVRYLETVPIDEKLILRAWLKDRRRNLCTLYAELSISDRKHAWAEAKFLINRREIDSGVN